MKILCFGDSITWGYLPDGQRTAHPWPDVLQSFQKRDVIINAGLPGRTAYQAETDLQWYLQQFHPDLTCILLGTNDLSKTRGRSVEDVIYDLQVLVRAARQEGKVLLMAPPQVSEKVDPQWDYRPGISTRMKELAESIAELCQKESCGFLNTQMTVYPSIPDGLHLNEKNHFFLGQAVHHYLVQQKK